MSEIRAISDESLAQAVEIVRDGGLIVIPTDTVYGVACDPRNIEAIRKVFAAKQRPKYKRCKCYCRLLKAWRSCIWICRCR